MDKTLNKRYYVAFFNASEGILDNLDVPKARGAGDIKVSHYDASLNVTTGFAECFIDFAENVWSNKLEEHLKDQGAACITILTFQHNDGNQSAGSALARIWKTAKEPGFQQITRGDCNPRLLAKAQEIFKEDEQAAVERGLDEKTQEAIKQSLKEMEDHVKQTFVEVQGSIVKVDDSLVKVDDSLVKVEGSIVKMEDSMKKTIVEDTKKVLSSIHVVEDSVRKTIVEDRVDTARLLERAEHAEHISYVVRGQRGAEESAKVKRLKRELLQAQRDNEKIKRQMQDRDRMQAERENRLYERIRGLEAAMVEFKDNQVEIKQMMQRVLSALD